MKRKTKRIGVTLLCRSLLFHHPKVEGSARILTLFSHFFICAVCRCSFEHDRVPKSRAIFHSAPFPSIPAPIHSPHFLHSFRSGHNSLMGKTVGGERHRHAAAMGKAGSACWRREGSRCLHRPRRRSTCSALLQLLRHGISSPLFFLFCYDSRRCSPLILNLSSELIAAPWPGEREIFSFGNMASRSSARLENLPLTRNVAAKISAPDDDKDSSYDPSKKRRSSVGDRMRAGMSDGNGRGDIQREVYSTPRFCFTLCF